MRDESYSLMSVEQALDGVLRRFHRLEAELVPIMECLGRVLAEDVCADMDIPPHANSAMDGYALQAADTCRASEAEPNTLAVIADLAAGYVADRTVAPGTAIRIMTGAPIPAGADAVVRFEDTTQVDDKVQVRVQVPVGENVRNAGEDLRQGALAIGSSTRLRPQEVGMLATVGRSAAYVTRRPRVAILATGDELVDIDGRLSPGKIRNSNSYANAAQVIQCGGSPILLGIARDVEDELTQMIHAGLERKVDLFLTSGGVSVGDFDVVKKVLAAEGNMAFWRVRMKPGKPFAFGEIAGVPLLGLPGNPVSAMISFEVFARPAIQKMLGVSDWRRPVIEARLLDGIRHKDDRRHYVRVRVEKVVSADSDRPGEYHAHLTGDQGSGILSSMVHANGIAVISEDVSEVAPGTLVTVMMLDQ